MTKSDPIAAEQTRQNVLKKRSNRLRNAARLGLPPPELNGVLGAIPGDERYLWPKSLSGSDMTVKVPNSVNLSASEILTFYLNNELLEERTLVDPTNDPNERSYLIEADKFSVEGKYDVYYRHQTIFGNPQDSEVQAFHVDHTNPNGNQGGTAPVFPTDIIENGLTAAYFDTEPPVSYVEITIPRSSDITAGDTILLYWGTGPKQAEEDIVPIFVHDVTEQEAADAQQHQKDPVVQLGRDIIDTLDAGKIGVLYRYLDRSGNLGQPSMWQEIYVDLRPLPTNLPAPVVDLAADGLIDRADARLGVCVEIPSAYGNSETDDLIQVRWHETDVSPVPLSGFPMLIPIDWPTLSAGGQTIEDEVDVGYSVIRGLAGTQSPKIKVQVNFTVAGEEPDPDPNPGGPDPINDKLPNVVVTGESGGPDNELVDADKGKPATVSLTPIPVKTGENLSFYWGTLKPAVCVMTVDDTTADPVKVTVPWDTIQEGGYNEKLPVYYTTSNGINEQESARTEVKVQVVDLIGLKPVAFPDQWPESTVGPVINCCSLPWNGIRIKVFDTDNFEAGDSIGVSWEAYSDIDGNQLITGTEKSFGPEELTDDMVRDGFNMTIPYDPCVEPIHTNGSGFVTYTLTKKSGQTGSQVTRVLVSRNLGSGDLCSPENPGNCGPARGAEMPIPNDK
ncbi:hypothetical protein BZK31_06465 [Pseudomonas floridensis]|uniref:Uncharacterized protein n=1 Tax=Pseudomonas floridensis TaxID=1958950 RepID=A0A1X0N9X6_9PSED|nr:hypothetical protein [Pseudomonas floridensis]ORC60502.1 hypothetical protein BZK31_06465 [Pseudomonas floridensis]